MTRPNRIVVEGRGVPGARPLVQSDGVIRIRSGPVGTDSGGIGGARKSALEAHGQNAFLDLAPDELGGVAAGQLSEERFGYAAADALLARVVRRAGAAATANPPKCFIGVLQDIRG